MLGNGFREGKKIGDEEESKDILLKQLEITHKRELEFGRYIMMTKGWAILILSAIIGAYFTVLNRNMNLSIFVFFCIPFFLLWFVETLMGAYQLPYYNAIKKIEEELAKGKGKQNLISLTYEKEGSAFKSIRKNFKKCAFRFSLANFFYGFLILLMSILWLSSVYFNSYSNVENSLFLNFIRAIVGVVSILVSIIVAIFICQQVKEAKLENRKSVVPALGITLKRDTIRNKKIFLDTLIVYARNNIALNVEWKIKMNGNDFKDGTKSAVIPTLKTDDLLSIIEYDIGEYLSDATKEKKLEFEANFSYDSILPEKNKYKSRYILRVWKEKDNIRKEEELESWELPWDC